MMILLYQLVLYIYYVVSSLVQTYPTSRCTIALKRCTTVTESVVGCSLCSVKSKAVVLTVLRAFVVAHVRNSLSSQPRVDKPRVSLLYNYVRAKL